MKNCPFQEYLVLIWNYFESKIPWKNLVIKPIILGKFINILSWNFLHIWFKYSSKLILRSIHKFCIVSPKALRITRRCFLILWKTWMPNNISEEKRKNNHHQIPQSFETILLRIYTLVRIRLVWRKIHFQYGNKTEFISLLLKYWHILNKIFCLLYRFQPDNKTRSIYRAILISYSLLLDTLCFHHF